MLPAFHRGHRRHKALREAGRSYPVSMARGLVMYFKYVYILLLI